jgi:hypothetical protein
MLLCDASLCACGVDALCVQDRQIGGRRAEQFDGALAHLQHSVPSSSLIYAAAAAATHYRSSGSRTTAAQPHNKQS